MGISDNDAETEVNDAIANDPEAQKLQDILTQLGLSLDVNGATGCMVDEEMIEDSDGSSSTGTSSASMRSQSVYGQQVRAQQTDPEIVYTTTPAGSNGMLHMVEGVNEENNLWLSWSQGSQNNRRDMITHIELFGDNSALDAALAQNMALGVRFTTLDDYNKRRIIHQLAQHTTLGQGATYAASSQSNGEQEVTSLQFGGQLLDVKNAEAVIVNQAIDPNNSAQLYGEALVVLPLVSNSRGSGVVNFALDDALYIRIPVIADINEPLWNVSFAANSLPDPMTEPGIVDPIEKLPADDYGFAIKTISSSAGWRTDRFRIQLQGHPDWTTPHSFKIVLGARTNSGGTIGFNDIQLVGSSSGSTSNIFQPASNVPYMQGTVTNGYLWYDVYVPSSAAVIFELKLDIDLDGNEETYHEVPAYYKETSGLFYRVTPKPGNDAKFALRTSSTTNFLPLSGVQACSSDRTNCISEEVYNADVPEYNTTIFDPDILDYWSTPLVVPRDFSLTTETLSDITRDNFYKNYTTERVNVLDIRAFSRWGYDFASAFDYCPYTYYDELAPFKRVLCEDYFDIWYQKMWEKENAIISSTLNLHNAYVASGIYDALQINDSTLDKTLLLAGIHDELDVESYRELLDQVMVEDELVASSVFAQQSEMPEPYGDFTAEITPQGMDVLECQQEVHINLTTNPEDDDGIGLLAGNLTGIYEYNHDQSLNGNSMVNDPALEAVELELMTITGDGDLTSEQLLLQQAIIDLEGVFISCMTQKGYTGIQPDEGTLGYTLLALVTSASLQADTVEIDYDCEMMSFFEACQQIEDTKDALHEFLFPLQAGLVWASLAATAAGAATTFGVTQLLIFAGLISNPGGWAVLGISVLGGIAALAVSFAVDSAIVGPKEHVDILYSLAINIMFEMSNNTNLDITDLDLIDFASDFSQLINNLIISSLVFEHPDCLIKCQEDYVRDRTVELREFLKWVDNPNTVTTPSRKFEISIGTVRILKNGLESGWSLIGIEDNLFINSTGPEKSWHAKFEIDGEDIASSPDDPADDILLFARGDHCFTANCTNNKDEINDWILEKVNHADRTCFARNGQNTCDRIPVVGFAFTDQGHDDGAIDAIIDSATQHVLSQTSASTRIPLVWTHISLNGNVRITCTPRIPNSPCDQLSPYEQAEIGCGMLGRRIKLIGGGVFLHDACWPEEPVASTISNAGLSIAPPLPAFGESSFFTEN